MEEARELAVQSLREEFGGLVEHICERFTVGPEGEHKKFKGSTITNFYEFFEHFKERNVFDDEGLAGLVEQAQVVLDERSPNSIRENGYLKNRIREAMTDVHDKVQDLMRQPRRKIVMN